MHIPALRFFLQPERPVLARRRAGICRIPLRRPKASATLREAQLKQRMRGRGRSRQATRIGALADREDAYPGDVQRVILQPREHA
jgi:hypothetical protein